jgi:RNA polymerase sigma factor (TIGR02999 family)
MVVSQAFAAHYQDLKAIAHRELARHQRETINTTALLHEAWIKLAHADLQVDAYHFRNQVAIAMRHILVDVARRKQAQKRQAIEPEDLLLQSAKNSAFDVLQIESLINWLASEQPRMAETVMLRVFANLEFEEIAEHQNVNLRTARRDWVAAMALLKERGD